MKGLYFFSSIRSVVFCLFFIVVYREAVLPSFAASVHSRVMMTRAPFFAMVVPSGLVPG